MRISIIYFSQNQTSREMLWKINLLLIDFYLLSFNIEIEIF